MTTCLKYCTPLAAVTFLGATLWTYFLPSGLFIPFKPYGLVREGQLLGDASEPISVVKDLASPVSISQRKH